MLRQRQLSGVAVAVNGSAPVGEAGLRRLDEAAQAGFASPRRGLSPHGIGFIADHFL
ncbi:hypothetical protein [Candidatus Chloroploca sp. Khr17]|uniref:hypothetical protein n=1 Tax=Candidatus Chloroploca sp. Khr17 TaxID=2496869 RepID=UPI0013EDFD46|nr:hypothetical protein [Candidatus Chloroploca sp. Khr17]